MQPKRELIRILSLRAVLTQAAAEPDPWRIEHVARLMRQRSPRVEQTEGAKFWVKVVNELRARRVNDILIAVIDGRKDSPRRFRQCSRSRCCRRASCIQIRYSLVFVSWKDRKAILPALKAIYRAE